MHVCVGGGGGGAYTHFSFVCEGVLQLSEQKGLVKYLNLSTICLRSLYNILYIIKHISIFLGEGRLSVALDFQLTRPLSANTVISVA